MQWYQPVALDDRVSKELNVDPVFENVPRSCRSRRRTIGKETIKVAESGIGISLQRVRTSKILSAKFDNLVLFPYKLLFLILLFSLSFMFLLGGGGYS